MGVMRLPAGEMTLDLPAPSFALHRIIDLPALEYVLDLPAPAILKTYVIDVPPTTMALSLPAPALILLDGHRVEVSAHARARLPSTPRAAAILLAIPTEATRLTSIPRANATWRAI